MKTEFKKQIKEELVELVKQELTKSIVQQIISDEKFDEIKKEIIESFFEEKNVENDGFLKQKELKKSYSSFVEKMDEKKLDKIKNGDYKILINYLLNGGKIPNSATEELTLQQISEDPLLKEELKTEACRPKIYNYNLSEENLKKIQQEGKENDEYHLIEFTTETIENLLDYLEKNKNEIKVYVEKKTTLSTKISGEYQLEKGVGPYVNITLYKVSNGISKYNEENGCLNPNCFYFEIEHGDSIFELKNVYINEKFISNGFLDSNNLQKIMDLVSEIFNKNEKEK